MHACVGVNVWACTRRMLTVIAARRCMHVWESVFGLVQGACSQRLLQGDLGMHFSEFAHQQGVIAAQRCMRVSEYVLSTKIPAAIC